MAVDWSSLFWVIDVVLAAFFSVELALRARTGGVVGLQSGAAFLSGLRNVVDLCAILPTYLDLIAPDSGLGYLGLLRLAQVVRLGRLAKTWPLAAPLTTVLVLIW